MHIAVDKVVSQEHLQHHVEDALRHSLPGLRLVPIVNRAPRLLVEDGDSTALRPGLDEYRVGEELRGDARESDRVLALLLLYGKVASKPTKVVGFPLEVQLSLKQLVKRLFGEGEDDFGADGLQHGSQLEDPP